MGYNVTLMDYSGQVTLNDYNVTLTDYNVTLMNYNVRDWQLK